MAKVTKQSYKVVFFSFNNVIQCRSFSSPSEATTFADGLPTNTWYKIVHCTVDQNIVDYTP